MTIRNVYVNISHRFQVDIPDELLADGREDELDDLLYYHFEDEQWVFDEVVLTDGNGNYV